MFSISAESGEGELVVGEWSEAFELVGQGSTEAWVAQWRVALRRLLERNEPTALLLDPPSAAAAGGTLRAWVCYPEGERVFVQYRQFVLGENAVELRADGTLAGIEPRETFTDYGLPIPERYCDLSDVAAFLELVGQP